MRLSATKALLERRDAIIVWFGHPRLATAFGDEAPLLCAWSGDPCMQAAVARWLAKQRG